MKWSRDYESPDVEDRRGEGGPVMGGGGTGWLFWIFWRFGWKGLLVAGAGYFLFTHVIAPRTRGPEEKAGPDEKRSFVGFVTDDVQKFWAQELPDYRHAKVVLYTQRIGTACGLGSDAQGPFYCPGDEKVYLDLSFFAELKERFGAPGEFAQAYVIGHELGHHVQKLTGVTQRVERAPLSAQKGATALSVRTELQADCYAGVWAHSAESRHLLDVGDVESALGAAAAVGDDRLQKMSTGTVQPESWTHGSAAERQRWFTRGYRSGDPKQCDTFSASSL
jgi:predicted metalloprotease